MAIVKFKNICDEELYPLEIEGEWLLGVVNRYHHEVDNKEIHDVIFAEKINIYLDGNLISVDDWIVTKVNKDSIVIIEPVIEGGGGGLLKTAIGVVLIAVAYVYGGPAGGMAMSKVWFGVMAVGLSLALGGISEMLFQPDLPNMNFSLNGGGSKDTQTYNWSGIKTSAKTDSPIPIVYGTHAIGGNVISLFVEHSGNDAYLYMLLALCEGEIEGICQSTDFSSVCSTTDTADASYTFPAIELDSQPFKNYNNIEWWYRTGSNEDDDTQSEYNPNYQNKIPYFDNIKMQYDDGRTINTDGIEYTTTKEVDMVYLNFVAPSLYDASGGSVKPSTAKVKIQFKEDGGSYHDLAVNTYQPSVSGTRLTNSNTNAAISGIGSYCICNSYINGTVLYGSSEPSYVVEVISNNFTTVYNSLYYTASHASGANGSGSSTYTINLQVKDSFGNIVEYREVKNTIHMNKVYTYEPHSRYRPESNEWISGYVWETVGSYSNSAIPIGLYSVTFTQNVVVGDVYTISSVIKDASTSEILLRGQTKTGFWRTVIVDLNNASSAVGSAVYTFRVIRSDSGASNDFSVNNEVLLNSVVEVNQGVFIYPNTALLGIRIKATDQLSGSPPNVITTIRGKKIEVPDLKDAVSFGSDVIFNDSYYDGLVFKDWDGNTVYWNDTTSFRTEYSNNAILCVRDLVLNRRFGLGKYISRSDLNSNDIINTIKDCHSIYNPIFTDGTTDHLAWSSLTGADYSSNIRFEWNSDSSIDSSVPKININAGSDVLVVGVYLNIQVPLIRNVNYRFGITLSGTSNNVDIAVMLDKDGNKILLGNMTDKGDGIHILDFNSPISGDGDMYLTFTGNSSSLTFYLDITDFSLEYTNVVASGRIFKYHTWNGVLESEQSALTVLLEMCNSFRCWPVWNSGTFRFVIDKDDDPVHTISISNKIDFSQSFSPISEIPKTLIGQFTDESNKFELRALKATSPVKNLNELNTFDIGLKGITNRVIAERELRFKLNKMANCTHSVSVKCGLDSIHAMAGDIINISDDLPPWGDGGRILDYNASAKTITIDREYSYSNLNSTYLIKLQNEDNSFRTATLIATSVDSQILNMKQWVGSPLEGGTYVVGHKNTYVKPFRLLQVNRSDSETIQFTAIEHLPHLYTAATLTKLKDWYTTKQTYNPLVRPSPPTNVVAELVDPQEGRGFVLKATAVKNEDVKEILVRLHRGGALETYEDIGLIYPNQSEFKYINNNLEFGIEYTFSFICKNNYKSSDPVFINSQPLNKSFYILSPPSGLGLAFTTNLLSNVYNSKNIVINWKSAGITNNANYTVLGYNVRVYNTTVHISNLLRTEFTSSNFYDYTYAKNLEDNGEAEDDIAFTVSTVTANSGESGESVPLLTSVVTPTTPSNLLAYPTEYGVNFDWLYNFSEAFKSFKVRTKVESDAWSSWDDVQTNSYSRTLTNAELVAKSDSTVYIEVKATDLFGNESAVATADGTCRTVSAVYYIKPTDGTAIKNSAGSITVEAHKIISGTDSLISTGVPKLYVGTTVVATANGYPSPSDGYTGKFTATNINNAVVVDLKNGPTATILDTISLVDIADGATGATGTNAVYGFVEPSNGLAWIRGKGGGAWTPASPITDLDFTFVQGGAVICRDAKRITLATLNGSLTVTDVTHKDGDLSIASWTVVGENTGAVTVLAQSNSVTVSEQVLSVQGGEDGLSGNANFSESATQPASPVDGDLWKDLSINPPILRIYNASDLSWDSISNLVATEVLFTSATARGDVEGWRHATDSSQIDGVNVYANTITATAISVTNLSAITADMGTITAGKIQDAVASTLFEIDCTNKHIKIWDAAGELRVHLGYIP